MAIYLVRHGETASNAARVVQTPEVPLSPRGEDQARRLSEAGLDYYNHNLDTGRSHYERIVTTRTYDDRLETLRAARNAGLSLCCGGILGMGEAEHARAELLFELRQLDRHATAIRVRLREYESGVDQTLHHLF